MFLLQFSKKWINFIITSAYQYTSATANSAFITDKKKCRVWRVDRICWFTRVDACLLSMLEYNSDLSILEYSSDSHENQQMFAK